MRYSRSGTAALVLAVLVLGACSAEPPTPASPSISQSSTTLDFAAVASSEKAAAVAGRRLRDVEDDILRMEAKLPGFGGLFVDSTGTVVVYGPSELLAGAVRTALAKHASEFHLLAEHQQQLTAGDRVRVLPARYAFSELLAWQQGLASLGDRNDGIISYDADESQNRVAVGVVDDDARTRLFARATAIGIPQEAITTEILDHPQAHRMLVDSFLTSTVRPLRAGAEIAVEGEGPCTMGFIVKELVFNTSINFLTAAHCTSVRGTTGEEVYQNHLNISNPIGTVNQNPSFTVSHPSCQNLPCTWADVMVVRAIMSLWFLPHTRWTTPIGDTTISGTSTITGEQSVYIGLGVTRVGKSTGTTTGTVDSMGTDGGVARTCEVIVLNDPANNQYVVLCAVRVKNNGGGKPGDSGGPLVNGTLAVGIHIGGTGPTCTGTGCKTWFNSLQTARSTVQFGNAY